MPDGRRFGKARGPAKVDFCGRSDGRPMVCVTERASPGADFFLERQNFFTRLMLNATLAGRPQGQNSDAVGIVL
jgi:hypothetical protein